MRNQARRASIREAVEFELFSIISQLVIVLGVIEATTKKTDLKLNRPIKKRKKTTKSKKKKKYGSQQNYEKN